MGHVDEPPLIEQVLSGFEHLERAYSDVYPRNPPVIRVKPALEAIRL